MSIISENPTAEAIYEALKQVPAGEVERLRVMLNQGAPETLEEEEAAWYQASHVAAARFFDDEERQLDKRKKGEPGTAGYPLFHES